MSFGSPLFPLPPVLNGIEIDMLSLGDADCIIVTKHENGKAHRILIDGGSASSADEILDFLFERGWTEFWAAVCTHPHNDHASGLIKIIQNPRIKIQTAFMHDIRNHIGADALRRAAAADDGVKEVLETTRELAAAFAGHKHLLQKPLEPFAGRYIADWPSTVVLGPSVAFYRKALEECTKLDLPSPFSSLGSILGGTSAPSGLGALTSLAPPSSSGFDFAAFLPGALGNSSVKENPKTQAFNNTSAILGVVFEGHRLLFTGDAGADALDAIPSEWKNLTWMQVPHHGSDGNLSQENIERFCPQTSYISACGDSSHPSRAIVNGLLKVRPDAKVFSTHAANPGHLRFSMGKVSPLREGYGPATPLKATGNQEPVNWAELLLAGSRWSKNS